jgi:hypothetical protein
LTTHYSSRDKRRKKCRETEKARRGKEGRTNKEGRKESKAKGRKEIGHLQVHEQESCLFCGLATLESLADNIACLLLV